MTLLTEIDVTVYFQMLPNIKAMDLNFKTLKGQIKIIPLSVQIVIGLKTK